MLSVVKLVNIFHCRYMEGNKEITRTYREEVKKLKERRAKLKNSLEKYDNHAVLFALRR